MGAFRFAACSCRSCFCSLCLQGLKDFSSLCSISHPNVDLHKVVPRLRDSFYKPPAVFKDVLRLLSAPSPAKHRVFLHGAPGIGKSSLAEAVRALCAEVWSFLWCMLPQCCCPRAWH